MNGGLLLLAPLRVEALALRRAAPGARVVRTGLGPRRARRAATRARALPGRAVAVAGLAGALQGDLRPGELVVASELRGAGAPIPCPSAPVLVAALRRRGLAARAAPVHSSPRLVTGRARAALAATGAVAVDMESAWLAAAAADPDRPLAVVRAVLDGPGRELADPRPALRALRAAAPVLAEWAAATGPRTVLLGAPRAFCAGVERAVEAVGLALEREGAPVHVRGQIVHNRHVVAGLERRGARFVREVDEVPPGAPVVLSAHGVAPSVRAAAAARGLRVIDATCPLVAKVHAEARRFADAGYTVLLVGHAGHEEVVGTLGEAPEAIRLVQDAADAERVEVADPQRVAYVTQTTLAVDETADVVAILRRRFPALVGPRREDICYATQNRQQAVRTLAGACDAVLVVGSANSSNSNRLVEVAERHGARARLVEDETALDLGWLAGARTLGVTAGASAPEALVQRVLGALRGLGPLDIREHAVARETARFKIPAGGR